MKTNIAFSVKSSFFSAYLKKKISVAPKSIVDPRLCAGTNAEVGQGRPGWVFTWAHRG